MGGLLKDGSFMGFSLVYTIMILVGLATGFITLAVAMIIFREEIKLALDPIFTRVIIALLTFLPFFGMILLSNVAKAFRQNNVPNVSVLPGDDMPVEAVYREVPLGRIATEKGDF